MRDSVFVKKIASDLEVWGITLNEKRADGIAEMIDFLGDNMKLDITDEVVDVAYLFSGISRFSILSLYTCTGDVPEFMGSVPAFEKDGQSWYRGFDIFVNNIRFRSSYLGDTKDAEDFHIGILLALLLGEYISISEFLTPFDNEIIFFVNFIKMASSLYERIEYTVEDE